MKLGLLWYDNDPKKSFEKKISEASVRFREKFGSDPNVCYMNPADLSSPAPTVPLRFIGVKIIRPHHFWLEHELD